MTLTNSQMLITVFAVAAGTALTRMLPILLFPPNRPTPPFVTRLQSLLPCAIIGLLVVYCLKDVNVFSGDRGVPELIAITSIALLHKLRRNVLLSIGGGTLVYMLLLQYVFTA